MSGSVWLLFTAGAGRGVAMGISAEISAGVHGEAVRKVEVSGGGPGLRHSATRAAIEAARILYRERYLDRQILVRFGAGELQNVHGESAELAFALALTAAVVERALPPVAATGRLGEGGGIARVEGVADKFAAALEVLPRGGLFAFPAANEVEVSPDHRSAAQARGITLVPCHRLEDLIARMGLPITHTWLAEPYRGLEPFTFSHASIFFGRGPETAELCGLVTRRSAVLVRGPSGAGKSSIVMAGVLPALMRREAGNSSTRWGLLRPRGIAANSDPGQERAALAGALADAFRHDEEGGLGGAVKAPASSLDAVAFHQWLRDNGASTPVLVIDQLEELFEARLHRTTIEALAAFLAEANQCGVILLATITNAALPELDRVPILAARFAVEGQFELKARHDAALLEAVISAPAAAAGLRFEAGLEAELLASASHGGADVLPLLELLLTELYERRNPATGELRFADYHAVGGLDGVVSTRAEAVFSGFSPEEQEAVALLLWKLNTAGSVETQDYPEAHHIHAVLAACQSRRLLVRDGASLGSGAVLRAAHEALLRHWSRAVQHRKLDEAKLELWHDLMREARQSRRGERALIPSGPQLAAAVALVADQQAWWTPGDAPMIEYIKRSVHQRQRRRLLSAAGLALPAIAGSAWAGQKLWSAWRALSELHVDFADLSVPGPDYVIPAEDYLHRLGITVPERLPDSSKIVIKNSLGLYSGRAAASAGKSFNFLTQEAGSGEQQIAPASYTLAFARHPRSVGIFRAALWAATESGVTHPGWQAQALDAAGQVVATVEEQLFGGYEPIPGKLFILGEGNPGAMARLRITSDFRAMNGMGDLVPFAAFYTVLINELVLYY